MELDLSAQEKFLRHLRESVRLGNCTKEKNVSTEELLEDPSKLKMAILRCSDGRENHFKKEKRRSEVRNSGIGKRKTEE